MKIAQRRDDGVAIDVRLASLLRRHGARATFNLNAGLDARREIRDGRARLQALFDPPVPGFAYPFGTFDDAVAQAVRDAGHVCARTTRAAAAGVETRDAMAAAPSGHFLAPDFLQRFERARPTDLFDGDDR